MAAAGAVWVKVGEGRRVVSRLQLAEGRTSSGKHGRGRHATPARPPKASGANTLSDAEDRILAQPLEHGYVFSPTTGRKVLYKSSHRADHIVWTDREMAQMAGMVLTHNHPSGSAFSWDDLIFAVGTDLAEMRAVGRLAGGERVLYSLRRPPGGWFSMPAPTQPQNVDPRGDYERALGNAVQRLAPALAAGTMGAREMLQEVTHEAWTRVSGAYGLGYTRTIIRGGKR